MLPFAFVLVAMLTVLAIVVLVPRLERPWLLPAARTACLTLTAAAFLVALLS